MKTRCVLAFLNAKINAIALFSSFLTAYAKGSCELKIDLPMNILRCVCMHLLMHIYLKHINYLLFSVGKSRIVLDAQLCCFLTEWIKPGSWFSSGVFVGMRLVLPLRAAGSADVELLGVCELLKKILLKENPYPWHPKNSEWLYSPSVHVLNFNTLVATLGSHKKWDNNAKSSWNIAIANRDNCFKAWCERNCRYALIFKQLHSSQQGPFATELFRITLFVVIEQSWNLETRRQTKMRN